MTTQKVRFSAVVSTVIDGDTFDTLNPAERIRLARVNAPEINSPGGAKAKQILSAKILNRVATIDPVGMSYGRIVAEVWVDGENINDYMKRQGY